MLATFRLPRVWVRIRWIGLSSMNRVDVWIWAIFVLLLGIFAVARFGLTNSIDQNMAAETVEHAGLVLDEFSLDGETIMIAHSQLDMGQVQGLFDHDTFTLIRGLEANPLVLDFEFLTPRPITGLVMDFGGMDFVLRVQVYGAGQSDPTPYQSEYRNQPPEPHVELSFADGSAQVGRIYIEIEQLNPPDTPHIHVREVLFKE